MEDINNESGYQNNAGDDSAQDQDRFLPMANVTRIMKKVLPADAQISMAAKETVQECASELVSYITGEASYNCQRDKRKKLLGDDLLSAMKTVGFEEYVEPLKIYLAKYRELEGKKTSKGRSAGGKKDGSRGRGGGGGAAASGEGSSGGVNSGGSSFSSGISEEIYGAIDGGIYDAIYGGTVIGIGRGDSGGGSGAATIPGQDRAKNFCDG